MSQPISIFNNIVGPVSAGPSSGSTCAPNRIAYWLREALGEDVIKARATFPANSGFCAHYRGMSTDKGIANGLIGRKSDHPDFINALACCSEAGIELTFKKIRDDAPGEAFFNMELTGKSGKTVEAIVESTGGGCIMIWEIDGFAVEVTGVCHDLFIYTVPMDESSLDDLTSRIVDKIPHINQVKQISDNGKELIVIESPVAVPQETIAYLYNIPEVWLVRQTTPVHPVIYDASLPGPPFHNGATLLAFLEEHPMELWQAAIVYESTISGWNKEQIMERVMHLIDVMQASVQRGLAGGFVINPGIMPVAAGKMYQQVTAGTMPHIPMGVMDKCIFWALAAMEDTNANGLVVCLPTGGSAGIAPAVILGVGEEMGFSRENQAKSLLTTGLIGLCMAEGNAFCGGSGGCMQEIGSASAMCAGGVTYYLGGTPKQALDAAALAMHNCLGMICDPVASLVQIPCVSRNLNAVGNSIICANIVVSGFDPVIPFDETMQAVLQISREMPYSFKGCGSGLMKTPTACAIENCLYKTGC